MNGNQPNPEPELDAEQAELSVVVVNPPNACAAQAILNQSWDTGDVICYFSTIDSEVFPKKAVVERITRLQRGQTTATGWRLVIIDDFGQQDLCCFRA
jgi:hypothetical protein